ncbi:MAG TPA: cyclic nucleotide-binding domain-containing protein [Burkholderiaceae bacterium]|jgi:CRP-like cAMP-binding protein|nr:cyclic nucleotide-binding domain-containing protein [Burkholderiaceae bacterium]
MNVQQLVQAMQTLNAYDAFHVRLSPESWRIVGSYLIRRELKSGDVLIFQGDSDRTMYFLESGTLQVYVRGTATQHAKIALLRAGSVVGEPALFGDTMRMAQVDAIGPCVVWALSRPRLDELLASAPELAYELLRAGGAVMAERMRGTLERGTPLV